ncbi:MAG: hypothetical protein HRU46_02240 [Verrucomicrobiales bacterium]|nr:hypothetical protein [Verrucomicrobiales bacterium]
MILEGPAELDIESPTKAIFRNGRLRAFVTEPARGFIIEGPSYDAVDLGTEFAMSVDANGESEIHVIDGEVAVHEKGGEELALLTAGKATRLDRDQPDMEAIDLDDSNFVDRQAMLQMSDEAARITHYLNGEAVATASTNRHVPVAFGPSEIGNWQHHPESNAAVRRFNGRVDEFLISRRAYSVSEIQTLCETGTPYR